MLVCEQIPPLSLAGDRGQAAGYGCGCNCRESTLAIEDLVAVGAAWLGLAPCHYTPGWVTGCVCGMRVRGVGAGCGCG